MKYLLLSVFFSLALISCKKEENTPIRKHEFGNCLKDEEPLSFVPFGCNVAELDTVRNCELITSDTYFPWTEEAGNSVPYYCCEEGDKIPFINQQSEKVNLSILYVGRGRMATYEETDCENEPDKSKIHCINFETVNVDMKTSLSEARLTLDMWPAYEDILLEDFKLGARLFVGNYVDRTENFVGFGLPREKTSFSFPADWTNLTKPFPHEFTYLPEIDILGKTFFEVYTHEGDLKGFYSKIYYNKEYGIVSFVDETGMQWRLDI